MANGLPVIYNGEPMYVVQMRNECPHLPTVEPLTKEFTKHFDITKNCEKCSSNQENWICLSCFKFHCGRHVNGHSVEHYYENLDHAMVLSLRDLSVWCYTCDDYVENSITLPVRNFIHDQKFGEFIPGSSKS